MQSKMWSTIHVILVSIFNLESPTALQVTDLTLLVSSAAGQAEGRVSSGLTSSSPTDVGAGRGCTHAAKTWGTAWQQTHGCRRSTAREAHQKLRAKTQSEDTLSYLSLAIKLNTYFPTYLK